MNNYTKGTMHQSKTHDEIMELERDYEIIAWLQIVFIVLFMVGVTVWWML